jgi:hypothetical protein
MSGDGSREEGPISCSIRKRRAQLSYRSPLQSLPNHQGGRGDGNLARDAAPAVRLIVGRFKNDNLSQCIVRLLFTAKPPNVN